MDIGDVPDSPISGSFQVKGTAVMGRNARGTLPQMRLHKRSGTARVRVGHKEYTLGRWGHPETHRKYSDFIHAFVHGRAAPPAADGSDDAARHQPSPKPVVESSPASAPAGLIEDRPAGGAITVAELCARYLVHAERYYAAPNGDTTTTLGNAKMAIRALSPYDDVPADRFGPLLLRALMESMVGREGRRKSADGKRLPMPRVTINATIKQVRYMFKWAASVELIPVTVSQALSSVPLLKKGRTTAPELPPVRPVAEEVVERTLPHLPRVIADMVRVQRYIGCRPGELCRMTPAELDRSQAEWEWRPTKHKTSWRDEDRVLAIGPRAQAILMPYLDRDPSLPCFLPAESEAFRNAERRAARKSPMTPSHRARRERARRKLRSQKPYDEKAYRRAIVRACELHGIHAWSPNQLRHAAAQEARQKLGLDAAQARLGHKHAKTTEIYAKSTLEKARLVAQMMG